MDISRRHFLWITIGIAAAGGGLYALTRLPRGVEGLVDRPSDVARFGVMHLCNDFDPAEARQRLLPEMTPDFDIDAATARVRQLIQEDLERADLVVVEGWFVTRTEADLAALIARKREERLSCT
jgi:hypothetical protein